MHDKTQRVLRSVSQLAFSKETAKYYISDAWQASWNFYLSYLGYFTVLSAFPAPMEEDDSLSFQKTPLRHVLSALITLIYTPVHLISHALSALPSGLGDFFLALFRPYHAFIYYRYQLNRANDLRSQAYSSLFMGLSIVLPSSLFAGAGYLYATRPILRHALLSVCQGSWQGPWHQGLLSFVLIAVLAGGVMINYGLQLTHALSRLFQRSPLHDSADSEACSISEHGSAFGSASL